MKATVITGNTRLRIWPTCAILAWLNRWTHVRALFDRPALEPDFTPGSLKVSDKETDGSFRKTITFSVPESSRETFGRMLTLSRSHLVAAYTDERGVDRLMGSCLWPATLSIERDGGSLKVTVSAWGDAPNPGFVLEPPCGVGLEGPFR